jgi:hypothetical protein
MHRANQHGIAKAAGDQFDAAEDERPHQDFAQLGVRLHERQQLVPIELDHLSWFGDERPNEHAPAGDHGGFAEKPTWPVRDDERVRAAGGTEDPDGTADQCKKGNVLVGDVVQDFSSGDRSLASMRRNPRHLCRVQRRKEPCRRRRRGIQRDKSVSHRSRLSLESRGCSSFLRERPVG